VLVNFLFNVLQLLITKHGGATLLVISAALALPVTNVAFKLRWIMGAYLPACRRDGVSAYLRVNSPHGL
jgi:hypothetical protein